MLRGDNTVQFEPEWRDARGTIIAFLNQQNISKQQWHDLFATVHRICTWVDGGREKVSKELEGEVHHYIVAAEKRIRRHEEESAILTAYITEWGKFFWQTEYLPKPFVYVLDEQVSAGATSRRNKIGKSPNVIVSSDEENREQEGDDNGNEEGNDDSSEEDGDNSSEEGDIDSSEVDEVTDVESDEEDDEEDAPVPEMHWGPPRRDEAVHPSYHVPYHLALLQFLPVERYRTYHLFEPRDRSPDVFEPRNRSLRRQPTPERGAFPRRPRFRQPSPEQESHRGRSPRRPSPEEESARERSRSQRSRTPPASAAQSANFTSPIDTTAGRANTIRQKMLADWNSTIFQKIKDKLQNAAMKLVEAERNGEAFDPQLVIGVRQSYVALNWDADDSFSIYKENFERAYIDATEKYYKSRAAQVLGENGVQNYMTYADGKLSEEEARGRRYLDSTTDSLSKLLERCVAVLVVQFQEQLLAECPSLIANGCTEKLKMLYRLINRTPSGIPAVLNYLDEYIRQEAQHDMMTNASTITTDPERYVEQLLSMFSRFSKLVKTAFYDDPRFLTARDKAFQDVVNDTCIFRMEIASSKAKPGSRVQAESRCPELLANYCDLLLRKTALSKRLSSEEIDAKLNDVLLVLKYVANKDVFIRFHKAHLARRLILEMSADQEKEEQLVTRLRDVGMPADVVSKLYRMLQDIEINKDLNGEFKKSIGMNNNLFADSISIKVLNAGAWSRGGERIQVQMPRELEEFLPEVEEFYRKQHCGRKLQWLHNWSHGTITFSNEIGKFDLDVTTLQLSVLFCWNDRSTEALSYESLRVATQLPTGELTRTLFSLVAFPKMRQQVLLTDSPSMNPRDFNDSTQFWINQQFAIYKNGKPQNRGRVNLIGRLQLSAEQNHQAEHDDIVALRVFRVQEAIVKVMKVRKRCQNAQLQTELVELLKHMFLPSKKLMKEQIEWLIDNKFIARDPGDINTFVYVS